LKEMPKYTFPARKTSAASINDTDRFRRAAAKAIEKMRRGASLHLTHSRSGSSWTLSPSGETVPARVALLVVNDIRAISAGDGLFSGTGQTWTYAEPST
jgi:hypothetical protein